MRMIFTLLLLSSASAFAPLVPPSKTTPISRATRTVLNDRPKILTEKTKTQFSLNLLKNGPPQTLFLPFVKWFYKTLWQLMLNELTPHDSEGRFLRDYSTSSYIPPTLTELNSESNYLVLLGNPCPWCHRISIALTLQPRSNVKILKLQDNASKARKGGWILPQTSEFPGVPDLKGVYDLLTDDEYQGRSTAPLLVDYTNMSIVTNESNDILKLLNAGSTLNLRPESDINEIEELSSYYFDKLSNGCYRTGFCTSQIAYDEACKDVIEGLTNLNERLKGKKFIMGSEITEIDVKLYPWVCRYDYVYSILFKSPGGKISNYPNILSWAKRVTEIEGMKDTIDLRDAVGSYYRELFMINPGGIEVECPRDVGKLFGVDC